MTNVINGTIGINGKNVIKLTPNQKLVYETLLNLERSAKAYELLSMLKQKRVNAAATVYRALKELANKGLVKRLASTQSYLAHPVAQKKDECAILLICKDCGDVSELEGNKFFEDFDQNIGRSGFRIESYNLELLARCDTCTEKSP